MDDNSLLSRALSEAEWLTIPQNIRQTLDNYFKIEIENIITNKALLETARFNAERELEDLKNQCDITIKENNELKAKNDAAEYTIKEYEGQINNLKNDLTKLQLTCNQLETDLAELRHQRNLIVDERDEHLKLLQRRNSEVEILQLDLKTLTKQLESAVNAKCEAIVEAEELGSLKLRLEYREKRIEQERILLKEQISSLTTDLKQKTDELLNMRRDNTLRCIQLENVLAEKSQELGVCQEHIKSLTDLNSNLSEKYEEISQKLTIQRDNDAKINESYLHEIESKNKLANTYKAMYEENQQYAEGLKDALNEVQQLLKSATDEYGKLETQKIESELAHDEVLAKKNDFINLLKKELDICKEAIKGFKDESFLKQIEGLSSTVSTSPNILKSDTTVTEFYAQYVTISEKLSDLEKENNQLKNNLTIITNEINEKGPLIKRLREEYFNIIETNNALKESNDTLLNELQQIRKENDECVILQNSIKRENNRFKKEINDLSRQVCHLLQEIEHSRVGSSSTSNDNMDLNDSINSSDIITKKLVTFNDIIELQKNNSKLLCVVRELTQQQEAAESLDPASIADLQVKLNALKDAHKELLDERDNQNKMMITLSNQRDMYKNFYTQAIKTVGEQMNNDNNLIDNNNDDNNLKINNNNSTSTTITNNNNEKIIELQNEIDEYKKKLDIIKVESDTYRKDKIENEKILVEQLNIMRKESQELIKLNCQLTSQCESNKERFKIVQNNIDIFKKQINALEKQNKIYSETIAKHEQTVLYLKDETIEAQTRLATAEVILGNLEKENALLKDAESRLLKERDLFKRDSHSQQLMQSNIELIKATLERSDAESKLKLESRIDEAHRECSALRRRLQEEQNHFRELTTQLEKDTNNYRNQINDTNKEADNLRNEILLLKDDILKKQNHINELTNKIKSFVFELPENNLNNNNNKNNKNDDNNNKILELQKEINEQKTEIISLNSKYKIIKEASEQYRTIASNAENQLKIIIEKDENYQKDINQYKDKIKELQDKISELENEISLQMDDKDFNNASQSKSNQLEEQLNIKIMDLNSAKEQLETVINENKLLTDNLNAVENKYAREVMLHSNDLQLLTTMKEELDTIKNELIEMKNAKENALKELEYNKDSFNKRETIILNDRREIEERCNELEQQNNLLLDEIQSFNTKLSLIQSNFTNLLSSSSSSTSSQSVLTKSIDGSETPQNRSFIEDEIKSSDQLLKVIKFLRHEKDIAVNKSEILEAEHDRLKSQLDIIQKQYDEAKNIIETERQKCYVSTVSTTKHAEILRKVETLNAVTDSNRTLRQERDTLKAEIVEYKLKIEQLENELMPLQDKNKELSIKAEAMQTENISLRGECTRWRQRAQMLIEKSNRTSPEDWKKLQNERETLVKQLTLEKSNSVKLNDELNNIKQEKLKLDDKLKNFKLQNHQLGEEINRIKDENINIQNQLNQLNQQLKKLDEENKNDKEEIRSLNEIATVKEETFTIIKSNFTQVRKIAKKYKIMCEDLNKKIKLLKEQNDNKETEEKSSNNDDTTDKNDGGCSSDGGNSSTRTDLEERLKQSEQSHKEIIEQLNQQIQNSSNEIENYKKEVETLKQGALEREDRFIQLFKSAKDRIVTLTEQNNNLKSKIDHNKDTSTSQNRQDNNEKTELLEKIDNLEKENSDKKQDIDKLTNEIDNLMQKLNHLQRQLGQQGSKPSTSSGSSEKPAIEPPTANIKPMAGHSTNSQTQSVQIHPWRSGNETPLASIRPMSAQLRTVTVLPCPSAVMIPPQQQVHTTGTNTIEALSSSPTSSHTDYVPATSSASSQIHMSRQNIVPSSQTEDDDNNLQMQQTPQQQVVALVIPRVEPPTSGPTQEQGTSSSSSNTVTTTQAVPKRQRDSDTNITEEQQNKSPQIKRIRLQQTDNAIDVEYQVPTSSQRDHDDDNVIVESNDEGDGSDDVEGGDDEPDDTEGYDMEVMEPEGYEDADCQDVGNEVEVIENSSEVPNQSERSVQDSTIPEECIEQTQPEATSSGTDGCPSGVTLSQASTSVSATMPSYSRTRPIAPLPSRQQSHLLLPHGIEEGGDDSIVPSTPTLFVPRRSDGFGEAVSSPHVPSGRFTFNESVPQNTAGSSELVPEQTLEVSNMDENSTGRSVPTTPLQSSPQESVPGGDDQGTTQLAQNDELPLITVSHVDDEKISLDVSSEECMGPPNVAAAGTSIETTGEPSGPPTSRNDNEGDDGVSSEGEKPPSTDDDNVEEGREAEATPSTNTRLRATNRISVTRRSIRQMDRGGLTRNNTQPNTSSGNTPIVWIDQRNVTHRHGEGVRGSRGHNVQSNYSPRVSRRSRGRNQRPYGRF